MKNKTRIILAIVEILLISILIFEVSWFYENIHTFASLSTKSVCEGWTEEKLNEMGYQTAGEFVVGNGKTKIEIFIDSPGTLKHEQCHEQQYLSRRLYSCEAPLLRYINEAECYFKERF